MANLRCSHMKAWEKKPWHLHWHHIGTTFDALHATFDKRIDIQQSTTCETPNLHGIIMPWILLFLQRNHPPVEAKMHRCTQLLQRLPSGLFAPEVDAKVKIQLFLRNLQFSSWFLLIGIPICIKLLNVCTQFRGADGMSIGRPSAHGSGAPGAATESWSRCVKDRHSSKIIKGSGACKGCHMEPAALSLLFNGLRDLSLKDARLAKPHSLLPCHANNPRTPCRGFWDYAN